jgi:hypothetical protein
MDMMIVLGQTLRAVGLDDFMDGASGKVSTSETAEALSLVAMARQMSGG